MISLCVSAVKSITVTISTAPPATLNWIRQHVKLKAVQDSRPMTWMSCIAYDAMIKWAFPSVEHAVGRSKSVWSPLWAKIGTLSISSVPSAKNRSWGIGTTRNAVLPTVKRITINCLAICALYAIKSSAVMVSLAIMAQNIISFLIIIVFFSIRFQFSLHWTRHGAFITSLALFATTKWRKNQNSTNTMRSLCAKNATKSSQRSCGVVCGYRMRIPWRNLPKEGDELGHEYVPIVKYRLIVPRSYCISRTAISRVTND